MTGPCGDGNALYLDCINGNILVGTLDYRFQDVTIGENWVKDMQDLSVLLYTIHVNPP